MKENIAQFQKPLPNSKRNFQKEQNFPGILKSREDGLPTKPVWLLMVLPEALCTAGIKYG